jgi:hypothetical protein
MRGTAFRTVREWIESVRTRWRRWRLLRAYSRVFTVRTGKRVGFTQTMAAYARAEEDGVLEFLDGEVVWNWPDDRADHADR